MIAEYNPKMPIIMMAIQMLYCLPECGAGGCCHIVTDDNNIDDDSLRFVIDYCDHPENVDRIDKELSKLICELLLQLSFEQRCVLFYMFSASYIHDYSLLDKLKYDAFVNYISDKTVDEMVELFA